MTFLPSASDANRWKSYFDVTFPYSVLVIDSKYSEMEKYFAVKLLLLLLLLNILNELKGGKLISILAHLQRLET